MLLLVRDHDSSSGVPSGSDSEALFREARRRQRRRWAIRAGAVVAIAGCVAAVISLVRSSDARRTVTAGSEPAGSPPAGGSARLRTAGPLAVSPHGALYIADTAAHRVLMRQPTSGRFRVIAGTGKAGYSGDGGPATQAELSAITDLAVSPTGSLYIADGGRIRVIGRDGVIRVIAGNGRPVTNITSGIPALSASLGSARSLARGTSWLSIAFGPTGQLYLSTGSQILRLTSRRTLEPVQATATTGPQAFRGTLRSFGPIAVDTHGNIDVSGVNGWAIWQIAPNGQATEVASPANARRSGGDYSVLERGPGGVVYGEDGPALLRIQDDRVARAFKFTSRLGGEYFWLTYFAFAPNGTMYADEIPGNSAFEARQQLVSVARGREALLWEQSS